MLIKELLAMNEAASQPLHLMARAGSKASKAMPYYDFKAAVDSIGTKYSVTKGPDGKRYFISNKKVVGIYDDLEKTGVVFTATGLKEELAYTDFEDWKAAVLNSYPAQAKKIKFKGRMEGDKDTISAEVPGEDRCYGVWDQDKEQGQVLSEDEPPARPSRTAFKLGTKIKIVSGPKDVIGKEGHIAEIRRGLGNPTFTVDYDYDEKTGHSKSVMLSKSNIKLA